LITPIIRPSISDEQHGFVGGCSWTVTSLVEFSNFLLSAMEDAVYTEFSKTFNRVNYRLLVGSLTRKFGGPIIFWMGSYLTGPTQRVRVGDYLSETICCHSGVADINDVLENFENFKVLAYANDLKYYMRVSSTDDCRLFQQDLDRLQGWFCEKKYDLNSRKLQVHLFFHWSFPSPLAIVISSVLV
jgi:hypothetical protein